MQDLDLDQSHIDQIYRNCGRGNPGYLASARRSLETGMSPDALIESLPEKFSQRYSVEWDAAHPEDPKLALLLAILAYDNTEHSLAELAQIVEQGTSELRQVLAHCSFLVLPLLDSSPISFISESFRRFAAERLVNNKERTWQVLADHYLNTTSLVELKRLPIYLDNAGRGKELLKVLNPGTFISLLSGTDSFLALQERCALGLRTAKTLKRYADVVRFQVQGSITADISQFDFAKAEVVARLALDDYPTALSIAQGAVLKRHRLQLMAAIAGMQKAQGLSPEPTLLQAIESLAQQVDPREFGDELVGVASDLIGVRSDIALSMIARLVPDSADSRNVDLALLRLSALAASNQTSSGAGMSAALEDIQSKIKSPSTRKLSQTVSTLMANESATEILRQAKSIAAAGEQLFLLRQWCTKTDKPSEAGPVIEYAVFLALRTTEYLPTAKDFRELCEPLPFLQDNTILRSLITALDLQKEAARLAGPTRDYVRWQLLLAEAEGRLSAVQAGQRLLETYYEVTALSELEVKAVCLALIVAALPKIDPDGAFKDTETVRELSEVELVGSMKELLDHTADHYVLSRGAIEALAMPRPHLALSIIAELNYESRRDWALSDLADYSLDVSDDVIPIHFLAGLLGRWADSDLEDKFVVDCMMRLSKISDTSLLASNANSIHRLLRRGLTIADPRLLCRALSQGLVLIARVPPQDPEFAHEVEQTLLAAWQSIGDPGAKLKIGYGIANSLADNRRDLALSYLKTTDKEKSGYDDLSRRSFTLSIRLLIRSYSGLLPQRLHQPSDLDRIAAVIERVPSNLIRTYLWADLAARMFRGERDEEARSVVQARLRPSLESLKVSCPFEWGRGIVYAAPALYGSSAISAQDQIAQLSAEQQEEAYRNVLRFVVTGAPTGEPAGERSASGYHLSYDKCVEVLRLVQHTVTDHLVYRYISIVVDSAVWRHNKFAPNQHQRNELANLIQQISRKSFPNPRFIKHEGFAILAEAQAQRLFREKQVAWEPLILRANKIDNAADRSFVLTYLGDALHAGLGAKRTELFDSARTAAMLIPAIEDQAQRLQLLAGVLREYDVNKAKVVLREAVDTVGRLSKGDVPPDELRRSLVDLAYQIDPEFASSVSSLLDEDDARGTARSRIAYQKARENAKDLGRPLEADTIATSEQLRSLAWDLLGSLNINRIKPRDLVTSLEFLGRVEDAPIHLSYPVLSWFLENLNQKRGEASEAKILLRDIFEGLLSACEVGGALVARAAGQAVNLPQIDSSGLDNTLISAGLRTKALKTITTWLEEQGDKFLFICDPYFGMKELEALELVLKTKPELTVRVITSKKKQEQDANGSVLPLDEAYLQYWTRNFSDQPPPDTEIVIVADASNELPIHDRWWLSGNGGIRMGTSFNQIGIGKDSEISRLTSSQYEERLAETNNLLNRGKLAKTGQKLRYETFWL